jgi:hypothetical protein
MADSCDYQQDALFREKANSDSFQLQNDVLTSDDEDVEDDQSIFSLHPIHSALASQDSVTAKLSQICQHPLVFNQTSLFIRQDDHLNHHENVEELHFDNHTNVPKSELEMQNRFDTGTKFD